MRFNIAGNRTFRALLFSVLLLALGAANYLYFRPEVRFLRAVGIHAHRNIHLPKVLGGFMNNHASDILWCCSLYVLIQGLTELGWLRAWLVRTVLLLPMLSELAQRLGLMPGTFDWLDMACYLVVFLTFCFFSPDLIHPKMKTLLQTLAGPLLMAGFLFMAWASTPSRHASYAKQKPQPCVTHKPLGYSPVLVKIYIGGTYTMKDLPGAQTDEPTYILNQLNEVNPGKYQLANGVTPNLNLYITYTTDNYQHYGAQIHGYVFDGDFYDVLNNNYVTFDRLDADIVQKVNEFIDGGWCKNCPSPCNP